MTVIHEPGAAYFYSRGGYQIVQALIRDTAGIGWLERRHDAAGSQ